MTKPTTLILLCEDDTTSMMLRAYLKRHGISHGIRMNVTQSGSGFDWVLRHYEMEIDAYRVSKAKVVTWLIVAIDADQGSVPGRINQLDARLKQSEVQRVREMRVEDERIARLVPRRNVETWLLALTGTAVTEEVDYKNTKDKEDWLDLAEPAGLELFNRTRTNADIPAHFVPSLQHAVHELRRLENAE